MAANYVINLNQFFSKFDRQERSSLAYMVMIFNYRRKKILQAKNV